MGLVFAAVSFEHRAPDRGACREKPSGSNGFDSRDERRGLCPLIPGRCFLTSKPLASSISISPCATSKLGEVLNKLLEMLRNNHLRMKGSFYLGAKALTQVEAIGRALNPDLNFIKIGEPLCNEAD